jgi:hypothetical protein
LHQKESPWERYCLFWHSTPHVLQGT